MSRNAQRLEEDKRFVLSAAPGAVVHVVPVDLGETTELQRALAAVDDVLAGHAVECVFFNAARLGASKILEWPAEGLERDLRMFSLAACKAAQFSVLTSLHKEYEPQGVHCAIIPVGGRVSDEAEVTNAANVAEEMWKLYSQPKGQGQLCVEMLDPEYEKHVRSRETAVANTT
ncbi:hypothetical protein LTR08_005306 [Meristemomyces frigidus]|nr:hypothetical protein LTR08_005306 [Meristemomyces frigidus]